MFWSATTRAVLLLSVILAVAIWVLGEPFGAIATGQATDRNPGLLLVLLAVGFWPLGRRRAGVASHDHRNAPVMAEQEMA